MTIRRMDHVGIVVADLAAATEFFAALGLEPCGETRVEGEWVDRIVGLDGVRAQIAMMRTPDGHGTIELTQFSAPASDGGAPALPANALGMRHAAFVVEDIDDILARLSPCGGELVGTVERYENSYRLCYVRGPAGIIVELAEELS